MKRDRVIDGAKAQSALDTNHDNFGFITRSDIMSSKGPRGGWSAKQLELIGIEWPPRSGWIDRATKEALPVENITFFKSFYDDLLSPLISSNKIPAQQYFSNSDESNSDNSPG